MSLLGSSAESLSGGGELEGPEEVVGLLERISDGPDLVDEVLNALDAGVLKTLTLSDDGVIGDGDSGSVDLTVSSLVDKSLDGRSGRVSVGDVRLNHSDHVDGGSGHSDEDTVMELSESEELHDFLALGAQLVDTIEKENVSLKLDNLPSGSDNKGNFGLSFDEVVSSFLCCSLVVNESLVFSSVLGGVLDGVSSGGGSGLNAGSLGGGTGGLGGSEEFSVSSGFLLDVFRNALAPKQKTRALAFVYC